MPAVDVVDNSKNVVGSIELQDELFGEVGSTHVVWEVVRHHLAAQRRGTHATKTRGEVSGGGRKPWRQKGTGRARVGSTRNPIWRHGGVSHGPQPRDYDHPMPRKKRRVALRRVVASMLADQRVTVLDSLEVEPKTKAMRRLLEGLGLDEHALVVVREPDANLRRASGNLRGLKVSTPEGVNAYDLLKHRHLLATREAMERLQEVLSR